MEKIDLGIAGAFKIRLDMHRDNRGFFVRTYDREFFAQQGLPVEWIQESHSFSVRKGTVRGLHFQRPPYAETKLVRLVQGQAFMVLLDLRKGSLTLGSWESTTLMDSEPELLYVPKGLALGMCTMTPDCSLLYKMDMVYHPQSAGTINWADKDLGITWPLDGVPVISEKDAVAVDFAEFVSKEGSLQC